MRALKTLLALLRLAGPLLLARSRLWRTLEPFAGAIEISQGRAKRFDIAFIGVFLHFGFLEDFESFLHFEEQ